MKTEKKLTSEDQANVDEFLKSGYNSTERRPFRPFRLLIILAVIVVLLGQIAFWYGKHLGVI